MLRSSTQSIARRVLLNSNRPPFFSVCRSSGCLLLSTKSGSLEKSSGRRKEHSRNHGLQESSSNVRRDDRNAKSNLLDLQGARKAMDDILMRISKLDHLPSSLSEATQKSLRDEELRIELFQDARALFHSLSQNVEQGKLRPSGKHGKELSKFLELVLLVYSQTPIHDNGSIFKECRVILDALEEWNLDFLNAHCEYAIAVASREQRWKDASDLFWRQVDPEAGYNPVDISVENPLGLYAIARVAQDQGSVVVEQVFDAVLRMSMVSPRDQAKYILAAGTALGKAGEWESAMEYLKNSYATSQLGQVRKKTAIVCNLFDCALVSHTKCVVPAARC
jgi:hypothetical protein